MRYLNIKTQAVVETACVISGRDWVVIEEQPKAKRTTKKTANKKSGDSNGKLCNR